MRIAIGILVVGLGVSGGMGARAHALTRLAPDGTRATREAAAGIGAASFGVSPVVAAPRAPMRRDAPPGTEATSRHVSPVAASPGAQAARDASAPGFPTALFGVDPAAATKSAPAEREYDYARLKALLMSEPIHSVDELLSPAYAQRLPESLRRRYLLVRESGSLQYASPMDPRIIFFTDDAKFIMAVSGHPREPGHESIEVISFNEARQDFDFVQVVFPGQPGGSRVLFQDGEDRPKPDFCATCHGQPSRPNWNAYNLWATAYGGIDDRIAPSTREGEEFAAFLAARRGQGRYAALVGLPTRPGEGFPDALFYHVSTDKEAYSHINSDTWRGDQDLSDRYRSFPRANYKFVSEAARLNTRRVAHAWLSDPDFPRMRDAVGAALQDCRDPAAFLADAAPRASVRPVEAFVAEAQAAMGEYRRHAIDSSLAALDLPLDACRQTPAGLDAAATKNLSDICRSTSLDPGDYRIAGKLAYAFAVSGKAFDPRNVSMVHTAPGYNFTVGNSGIAWLKEALRVLGDLKDNPLFGDGPLPADVRAKCQGG